MTGTDTRRLDLRVTVAYDSDINKVKDILFAILNEDEMVLKNKALDVFVDNLGDSGIILGVRCYTKQADFWTVKWRVLESIKQKFDENNIEIPYTRMDVTIRQ